MWNHLSDREAIIIALENEDAPSAADAIVHTAMSKNQDKDNQENATAIVVYFDLEA